MLRIRKEQLPALRSVALDDFVDRGAAHLRRQLPALVAHFTAQELRERVRACIPRCDSYRLTSPYDIMCFVDATFLLGERFDEDPAHAWAADLLGDDVLAPATKADRLLRIACERGERTTPHER
jgi:hypothetical protein